MSLQEKAEDILAMCDRPREEISRVTAQLGQDRAKLERLQSAYNDAVALNKGDPPTLLKGIEQLEDEISSAESQLRSLAT